MQTHRLSFCKRVEVHIPCTFEIIVKILLKIVPSNAKYHDIAPSTFPPTLPGTWVQKGQPWVHLNSYLVQRESTMQKILLFKMPLSCLLGKGKKNQQPLLASLFSFFWLILFLFFTASWWSKKSAWDTTLASYRCSNFKHMISGGFQGAIWGCLMCN